MKKQEEMRRGGLLVSIFFILSLKFLPHSACESTSAMKAGDMSSEKPPKSLHYLGDSSVAPVRECDRRPCGSDHEAHALRIFERAKVVYGGANDVKRPRHSRHGDANSLLIKSSSGLFVVLRHVIVGLLVSVFFF